MNVFKFLGIQPNSRHYNSSEILATATTLFIKYIFGCFLMHGEIATPRYLIARYMNLSFDDMSKFIPLNPYF